MVTPRIENIAWLSRDTCQIDRKFDLRLTGGKNAAITKAFSPRVGQDRHFSPVLSFFAPFSTYTTLLFLAFWITY